MRRCRRLMWIILLSVLTIGAKTSRQREGIIARLHSTPPGLYVPEDMEATLWATSPMFYNPTNMDVDIRGRIWITEAVNYRNYNNDSTKALHHSSGDRVMILEDTNQDGKADLAKLFVQDK